MNDVQIIHIEMNDGPYFQLNRRSWPAVESRIIPQSLYDQWNQTEQLWVMMQDEMAEFYHGEGVF